MIITSPFFCFEKFFAYTIFLPTFIVARLKEDLGLFAPCPIYGSQTPSKIGLTLFHMGGGADSAPLHIIFFITSVRDAAEPQNLVTFPKI